jgi:hypothetical protein
MDRYSTPVSIGLVEFCSDGELVYVYDIDTPPTIERSLLWEVRGRLYVVSLNYAGTVDGSELESVWPPVRLAQCQPKKAELHDFSKSGRSKNPAYVGQMGVTIGAFGGQNFLTNELVDCLITHQIFNKNARRPIILIPRVCEQHTIEVKDNVPLKLTELLICKKFRFP